MKRRFKNQKGQAIVEYIIVIVIVAVAGFVVLGAFSDRIRNMIAGASSTFGDTEAASKVDKKSTEITKELTKDGIEDN